MYFFIYVVCRYFFISVLSSVGRPFVISLCLSFVIYVFMDRCLHLFVSLCLSKVMSYFRYLCMPLFYLFVSVFIYVFHKFFLSVCISFLW